MKVWDTPQKPQAAQTKSAVANPVLDLTPQIEDQLKLQQNTPKGSFDPNQVNLTALFDSVQEELEAVAGPEALSKPGFKTLTLHLGDQTLEIPAVKLTPEYLKQELQRALQHYRPSERLGSSLNTVYAAKPVLAKIRPDYVLTQDKLTAQQQIQALVKLQPEQISPANLPKITEWLAAYNTASGAKPKIPPQVMANLETLLILQASRQSASEAAQTLSLLPGIDANDVQLFRARGSLALLGQLNQGGDLGQLTPKLRASLLSSFNRSLKLSGSNLEVKSLRKSELQAAVRDLEQRLGLPPSGSLSPENLRQIEKTQKNLYVMMDNVRNILHDEVLPDGLSESDKKVALEQLVGKGSSIDQKTALAHLQVLRGKYHWLINKNIPSHKPLDLYFDTLKARQSYLAEKRDVLSHHELFTTDDLHEVIQFAKAEKGGILDYSRLQAIAGDDEHYSLKQRDAARKLIETPRLYDYIWSIDVGDSDQNGKLDRGLAPRNRTGSYLQTQKLAHLQPILSQEKISFGDQTLQGIHLPEFYDGRQAAAKIYDAANVSGDGFYSYVGLGGWGLGTDEEGIKNTLKESQLTRGQIMALKRDYERLYQTSVESELKDELGGGDLGEALAYEASPGEDVIAREQVGSVDKAVVLLAKFKPQIDQIGADNGAIAWASGHSSADQIRQHELQGLYREAQQTLKGLKSHPSAAQQQKLLQLTSQILIRLQADTQADRYYEQAKDEAIDVGKNVAIIATATVVTVATGGAGAPLLLAAAAGTAAGTAVAFTGEAADQINEYYENSARNAQAQALAQKQEASVAQVHDGDAQFKTQILKDLNQNLQGLQSAQDQRQVFDSDKLLTATWEGFKTSLVTSVTTVATMGLGNLASAGKVQAVVESLGKAGTVGRQALINGLSGLTGDLAGQLLAPLHLNSGDPEAALRQLDQHLAQNQELEGALRKEVAVLKARVQQFYQTYQPEAPSAGSVQRVQTVRQPSAAALKKFMQAQVQLGELQANLKDLSASNREIKGELERIKAHRGDLMTWNAEEWQQISNHLGRSLAISFVAGAALNLVNGNRLASRIALNASSGALEQVGRNALDKYVDGKRDKDLFEGVAQNVLSSLIAGEAAHHIHGRIAARQGLHATLEGRTFKALSEPEVRKQPQARQTQKLLEDYGFRPEDPNTHRQAFEKLAQHHPELNTFVQGHYQTQAQQVVQEVSAQIGSTVRETLPAADPEATTRKFWDHQGQIQQLQTQKESLRQQLGADPKRQSELRPQIEHLEQQQKQLQAEADAIQAGELGFDASGESVKTKTPITASTATPPELSPRTRQLATELSQIATQRQDAVGSRKIQQVLSERASGLNDALKAEFLSRVKERLQLPENADKSVFDVIKEVVKADPETFTKKGDQVPLEALQAEGTFSRVVTMTALFREYLRPEAKKELLDEFGIRTDKEFAAKVEANPGIFRPEMLNPEALISGGNDTAWWSPKGQSEARNPHELASELAVDPKRFAAGTLRLSIEPEELFALGLRKPTALDGMFAEWVEVPPDAPLGKTDGGKSEGVIGGIPFNKLGTIEIFSSHGRRELSMSVLEQVERIESHLELRGGSESEKQASLQKLQQILNESANELNNETKGEFLKRVETRLADPAHHGESVWTAMKAVVGADPAAFTKKGNPVPLETLQAEGTFSRAVPLTDVYRHYLLPEAREQLLNEFGIRNEKDFAAKVQQDPSFFKADMLDPEAPLSGGNETAWWSPKGQSEAQTALDLAAELDLVVDRYAAGALRFSVEPETMFAAGMRKPTALDGMFEEWGEAHPQAHLGKTATGDKPEGVVGGIPLKNMGQIEFFSPHQRQEIQMSKSKRAAPA